MARLPTLTTMAYTFIPAKREDLRILPTKYKLSLY